MLNIKSSTDLRNNYNEVSKFCHETDEPIFITKNGRGDLAVMSIGTYNKLQDSRKGLYRLLEESEEAFANGRKSSLENTLDRLEEKLDNGTL